MVKLRCIAGEPAHDILEVVNPMGDDEHSDLLKELHRVRNMLLCYRLVHRNDKISNITINLKNREKQLFKPVLRLFQNTKTMPQLSIVISNYINERRKTKLSGLHSFLIQLVDDMMTDKGYGNIGVALAETVELDTSDIWAKVQSRTSGQFQSGHPLTYETVEFGPVSQKQVTGILEDIFKAEIRNSNGTRKVVFMRKNLEKVRQSYDISDVVVSASAIPKPDTTTAEGTEEPGKND